MVKRNRPPRRPTGAEPRPRQANPVPASGDQEAVDGIPWSQVKKTDLSIAGEQPGHVQKLPGYEVCVAIPEWDKNRSLLDPVRKAHLVQQKLLARLQGEGVSRPWMIERFNEVDKALAATLATVAKRFRTRRWREKERGEALHRLQATFAEMQRWTAQDHPLLPARRTVRRSHREGNRPGRRLSWHPQDRGAHQQDRADATRVLAGFQRRAFPRHATQTQPEWTHRRARRRRCRPPRHRHYPGPSHSPRTHAVSGKGRSRPARIPNVQKVLRDLEPTRPSDAPMPDNSIAIVGLDENNRFVITRVGRSEENRMMISSSVTGSMNLSVYAVRGDPTARPPVPDEQG